MEDNGHEINETLEQPGGEVPVITSKRRKDRVAAQPSPEENKLTAIEGGKDKTRERKIGLLPTAATEEKPVKLEGKIIEETTWTGLKGRKMFSVNADGSHPYLKLSKSSYYDLVTEEVTTSVPINSQQKVYRIKLL